MQASASCWWHAFFTLIMNIYAWLDSWTEKSSLYLIHNRCTASRRNFSHECHEWLTWQLLSEFYLHYDLSMRIFQSHSQEWWASQRLSSKLFLSTFLQRMKKMRLALSISGHRSLRDCCSIALNSMIDLSLKLSQSNLDSQIKMSSLT